MKHDKFIQKEKMIEMIKRHPNKYTVADLQNSIKLSNPTIRREIEKHDLISLVLWERPKKIRQKKKQMSRTGCFTDTMLKETFIF